MSPALIFQTRTAGNLHAGNNAAFRLCIIRTVSIRVLRMAIDSNSTLLQASIPDGNTTTSMLARICGMSFLYPVKIVFLSMPFSTDIS